MLLALMLLGVPCALVFYALSGRIAMRLGSPGLVWAQLIGALPCMLLLFVFAGLSIHLLRANWHRFLNRDGHCLECGYDLSRSGSDRCPEYNAPIWR